MLCRDTSAGRTAGLCSLELLAIGDTAADLFDDLTQGSAHRDFDQTGVVDLAAQCKYLSTFALFGAHRSEPVGTLEDDLRDIRISLDVVQDGRFCKQALDSRERRTGSRFAAVAFNRGHQSGFLAADECACAQSQVDIKVKAGAEDILAQQAVFSRLFNRNLQTMDCDRVFSTDIDVTLRSADCITSNRHCFQYDMGVAFQNRTVHECAGVTFVGVAADVFLVGLVCSRKAPFTAGRETCAAASAQTGCENHVDNLLRGHFGQDLAQCLITVDCDVLFDILRVDNAAVAQCNTVLFCIEVGLVQRFDAVVFLNGLLVEQAFNDTALEQVLFNNFRNVRGFNFRVEGTFRVDNHDRAECAQTKAAGFDDFYFIRQTGLGDLLFHCVDDLLAVGRTASVPPQTRT